METKQKNLLKDIGGIVLAIVLVVASIGVALTLATASLQDANKDEVVSTPNPTPVVETETIDLMMAGDALIHGAVYSDALQADGTYDFSSMLENLSPITSNFDLRYYNQETILGGDYLGFSGYPRFNTPQSYGDNMIDLGFNMVSQANNHALDKNEEGILNSIAYWKSKPMVVTAGTYESQVERDEIAIHECDGISYAFLAYTYGTNGLVVPEGKDYLVNVYTEDMLVNDIKKARDKVDVVIVSMHWGIEYTHTPTDEQTNLAHVMANAGADIIIGSHPHVIQPIQWIDDTIVFYSLGNLISAQDTVDKRIGMLGAIKITKTTIDGVSSIELSQPRADLVYTYYDNSYHNFKLYTFDLLDNSILPNYEQIYDEYGQYITEYDDSIRIGGLK